MRIAPLDTLALILVLAFSSAGCGDDTTMSTAGGTGKIETSEIQMDLDPDGDGVATAALTGDVASMTCALSQPLQEIGEVGDDATTDDALAEVAAAMDVTVRSPRTGATASLAGAALVASPPAGGGQWSMSLSNQRATLRIQWFNATADGLTMKAGETYDVMYSLAENCCIEEIETSQISFAL